MSIKNKRDFIILIEDDPVQAMFFGRMIKKIAEELGLKSKTMTSGTEFLVFILGIKVLPDLHKDQVGLIILDLQLPNDEISGFYILKEVQKLKYKIPIIVQSADSKHTSIIKAMKLGAKDYFLKDGQKEEGERIFDTIEEIMGKTAHLG